MKKTRESCDADDCGSLRLGTPARSIEFLLVCVFYISSFYFIQGSMVLIEGIDEPISKTATVVGISEDCCDGKAFFENRTFTSFQLRFSRH